MSLSDKRYFQHTLHYFPSVENDASRLTWAHAVNSREKLEEAIRSSLMFIEADILIGSSSANPIMAHPPHTTSDLTFSEFLQEVKSTSKGLKLDFKDINALQSCLNELEAQKDNINGPIILNADIVRANPQCAQPVNAQRFLNESLTFAFRVIPQLMISFSLGWTTIYDKTTTSYTWSTVIDMYRTITRNDNYSLFNFEITFPVRLSLALNSFEQLHWLATVTKSGLTFWSPINEVENTSENLNRLLQFRAHFNRSLIYYDLPTPFDTLITENFYNRNEKEDDRELIIPSMKDHWHTTVGQEDNVLVSDFSAVLLKSHVFLRTKQTFDSTLACTWSGTIEFLTDASSQTQAALCYLAETEHTSKAGMTITISKTGSIEVVYENSQGSSQVDENLVFPSYAYAFRIKDSISKIHIEISSLYIENFSSSSPLPSTPTSVQLTVFLDTNRRRLTSSDESKDFHAAVMGQNIEQMTSTNNIPHGGIVFSRLHLTQESLPMN